MIAVPCREEKIASGSRSCGAREVWKLFLFDRRRR